jgi:hypothetical protein
VHPGLLLPLLLHMLSCLQTICFIMICWALLLLLPLLPLLLQLPQVGTQQIISKREGNHALQK